MATAPAYNPNLTSKADLLAAGYKGYTGWNDEASIMQDYKETGGSGKYDPGQSSISSTGDLSSYLDSYQDGQFNSLALPDLKIPTADELKSQLTPTTPKPELLDRAGMYEGLRTTYGIAEAEDELNTLKAEERQILAQLREVTGAEEGKPVALNVMAGRISEEQRQAQTKLDYLNVRKATLVDELNTKYNVVSMYMNFANLDYQDAVKAYESEFAQNVQIQNLLSGFRQEAWTYATDTIKLNEQIKQNNIDNARANLATITNAITAGNMDFDSLSADQKLLVQKLEVQSGLPVGVVSAMKAKADPQADIVFTTSNEGITQVGFRNPDGTISVQSYGTRVSSGGGTATERLAAEEKQYKSALLSDIGSKATLQQLLQIYGDILDPNDIYRLYNTNSPWGPAKEIQTSEGRRLLSQYGIKVE